MTGVALLISAQTVYAQDWFKNGFQEVTGTAEWLSSSDVSIDSYNADWSWEGTNWQFDTYVGSNHYDVEYTPTLVGVLNRREEETERFGASVTRTWNDRWTTTLSGRYYDGFSDYRSIWISEFYRQLFGTQPQYTAPTPEGIGFTLSTTWFYLPNAGQLELIYDYGRDTIAPGWGFDPDILDIGPGNDQLDTHTGRLRVEHAIAPWLETELSVGIRNTTSRDPRFWAQNYWAAAYGKFGFRAGVGYAVEDPDFEAVYGDALVELALSERWAAYAGIKLYKDSGEIENSGFNLLAPELNSNEVYIGLRYETGQFSANVSIGKLDTDYDDIEPSVAFVGPLYRDRVLRNGRISISYNF